jgi:propanol-preferring alcohol dehydrogenase
MTETDPVGAQAVPATMRAVRLEAWGRPPVLTEVPVPSPGPGAVLLRVQAAGLCHSDLHVMDAAPGVLPYELPFTLGHEVVGSVARLGDGVPREWLGRSCAVHGIWSCGRCRNCRRGRENYCLHLVGPVGGGLGLDGGLADYVLVPDLRHLVPVDDADATAMAPLTDAGLTALHAVRTHLGQLEGDGVAVLVGIGGLGHLALQIVRAITGARTVAVDTDLAARDLALRLGADAVTGDLQEVPRLILDVAGEAGADLVLDFVGAQTTLDAGAGWLTPGGTLAVVGSAGGELTVAKGRQLPPGWTVAAPFWGPRQDLEAVVALARRGAVAAEVEVFPIEQALEAYGRLRESRVRGRAVVVPAPRPGEEQSLSGSFAGRKVNSICETVSEEAGHAHPRSRVR